MVVVVVVTHRSSQPATQAAKTVGLVGHCEMHADSDPPGHSSGVGAGAGDDVVVAGEVVVEAQSSAQTPMQTSYAEPVKTAQAVLQADKDPPGHGEGLGGGGLGVVLGGDGGPGVGVGVGGTLGFVVSMSPTFKFMKEYDDPGCSFRSVSGFPTSGSHGPRLHPGSEGSQPLYESSQFM